MQSSSRRSYIAHHRVRIAAETIKLIDRLATWVLMLAVAAGVIIIVLWLVTWCDNSIFFAGAQQPHMPQVVFGATHHECGGRDAFAPVLESQAVVPILPAVIASERRH